MPVSMRHLCLLALACCVAAAAATRPPVYADLADRARALPPDFAAGALLRIADASAVADVAWKRQILEDAFRIAAGAQQPYARRYWSGKPGSLFDKAYAQGLDVCTLQCKAVHAMLAIDYKKARELFSEIPAPSIPQVSCDDALVYDVSIFYATAAEISARAFSAKEIADDEPFHLLQRFSVDVTSPIQIAPIARMLAATSMKPALSEALVNSLAGALQTASGDDRSFSATLADGTETALAALQSPPLLDAWRAYVGRQIKQTRCGDPKPEGQCSSPECRDLAATFTKLVMAPSGYGLSPEQKSTAEWSGKLRQYLAALAAWKGDDDPVEYFQFKTRFYSQLLELVPAGPDRDLVLGTLLAWLQQSQGYQREHAAEWFYPVNALIIRAFAESATMKTTLRELRRSADPVISLYAQLEQLLPRPMDATMALL